MVNISSNYLKSTIEELNDEILYDPTEGQFTNPNLPLTQSTISKCWKYFTYDSADGENFEKFPISEKDYNPKTDQKVFDFECLENTLNLVDLKRDLHKNISIMQDHYISAINKVLLNQSTDLQISSKLSLFIEDIRHSTNSLNKLNTNRPQGILKEILLRSYNSTIEKIQSKYSKYLPKQEYLLMSVEEKELNEFIYPDRLSDFKKIEFELNSNSWLILNDGLKEWNRTKTELVDLCRFIKKEEISRGNKSVSDIARFLEDRYTIDVGTLKKPSKFKKRKLKTYEFDFLLE